MKPQSPHCNSSEKKGKRQSKFKRSFDDLPMALKSQLNKAFTQFWTKYLIDGKSVDFVESFDNVAKTLNPQVTYSYVQGALSTWIGSDPVESSEEQSKKTVQLAKACFRTIPLLLNSAQDSQKENLVIFLKASKLPAVDYAPISSSDQV
jgi:hypothetical protein